ncbi:hypothetical protein HYW54_00285 [Candidatus Gottesmanbacteria bacterium]|nr:hypothetical protein [Candidatus Gottesmanbacteria bacterium]
MSDYKAGKVKVIMFLVGQVMKELKGKGNAGAIKEKLLNYLSKYG